MPSHYQGIAQSNHRSVWQFDLTLGEQHGRWLQTYQMQ